MSSVLSVATAVPPHRVPQAEARKLAEMHFGGRISNIERYLTVFDNSLVEERFFCVESGWFFDESGLGATNRLYLEWAERLAAEAARTCLEEAGVRAEEVGSVIFVSSTGIATPSVDAALVNVLSLPTDVRRVPLFGLGCGGGAAGLAIANELATASPRTAVLLVAVELNSLTFQRRDFAKSNLVASSLFGDGAAAVLVMADPPTALRRQVEIVATASHLKRGSEALMGWDFVDTGFRVVFSRRIPAVIREMMPAALEELGGSQDLSPDAIDRFVVHPGGRKILEAYQALFGRGPESFASAYRVLARYGNMSSATVLFVLREELRRGQAVSGSFGLLAAFGPGFSAEASLLQWH